MNSFHFTERINQPRQVNAENFTHASGALIPYKEIFVAFPRVPVGQILSDMIQVIDRLVKRLHLLFDILCFRAVEHRAGQKQHEIFVRRLLHQSLIPVGNQVQLCKHIQICVEQYIDDTRMRQRGSAHQSRIVVFLGQCSVQIAKHANAQRLRFFAALR